MFDLWFRRCVSLCLAAVVMFAACAVTAQVIISDDDVDDDLVEQSPRQAPPPREREFSFDERVILIDEAFPYDESNPAAGHWHGNVFTPFGVPAAAILISVDEEGVWHASSTVTPGAPPHQSARDVRIDGREVEFLAPLEPVEAAGSLRFVGTISDDGQRMTGRIIMPAEMIRHNLRMIMQERERLEQPQLTQEEANRLIESWSEGRFELARTPRAIDLDRRVAWGGPLDIAENIAFEIVLCFAQTPGGNWVGHIDIPQQYVGGWVLDQVRREDDRIIAHMGGGSPAVIEGRVSEDGETFKGVWTYPHVEEQVPLEFSFSRIEGYDRPRVSARPDPRAEPRADSRPQYPSTPLPYRTREVSIEHADQHVLSGTLSLPHGPGPFPAVILVSTSGPHDRDAMLFGHKWFLVLGDRLTRHGFAVLRYDERGIGRSTGRFQGATLKDLASDVAAAYNFLRALEDVDPDRIGLVGHGEGASVAAIAAAEVEGPAALALLAPSGVPGWRTQVSQLAVSFEQQDPDQVDRAAVDRFLEAQAAFLQGVAELDDEDELRALAIALAEQEAALAETLGSSNAMPPAHRARMLMSIMRRPDTKFMLSHDPLVSFRAIECPVFVAWGSLDRVNDVEINLPPVEEVLNESGVDATVHAYTGLNHLFQPAQTGYSSEYGRIPTTIDERLLSDLNAWLSRQFAD